MPTFLYGELTQRMPKILEPRYEKLKFENGLLLPTETDLEPGAREIAFERFSEFGDADLLADAGTNIPIVDISIDEDRYPIFMLGSGFPISFQEERAIKSGVSNRGGIKRAQFDRYDRRMAATRKVIAMRMNRFLAYGRAGLGMQGFVNNSLILPNQINTANAVGSAAGSLSLGQATYQQLCDFFVEQIESITDNFVSNEPTQALISPALNRRLSVQNPNGTKSVRGFLAEEYPDLEFEKTREVSNASLTANGVSIGGRDRIILYPKLSNVVHRHIEFDVAQLVPEDYVRVDGLRKIYTMFSCFSPAVIDFPQDVRYIDAFTA